MIWQAKNTKLLEMLYKEGSPSYIVALKFLRPTMVQGSGPVRICNPSPSHPTAYCLAAPPTAALARPPLRLPVGHGVMRRPLSGAGPSCDGVNTPQSRSSRISTRTRVAEDGREPSDPRIPHPTQAEREGERQRLCVARPRRNRRAGPSTMDRVESSRIPRAPHDPAREFFYRYGTHSAAVLLPSSPPSGARGDGEADRRRPYARAALRVARPGDDGDAEATPSVFSALLVWRWRVPPPMERTT